MLILADVLHLVRVVRPCQAPLLQVKLFSFIPRPTRQQRQNQNANNPAAMFALPAMQQYCLAIVEGKDDETEHGVHALHPTSAVERSPAFEV